MATLMRIASALAPVVLACATACATRGGPVHDAPAEQPRPEQPRPEQPHPEQPPLDEEPPPDTIAHYTHYPDVEDHRQLIAIIRRSAHNYFRFVATELAEKVCKRMGPRLADAPEVNLHGDPHLEQFAVTARGQGLADFDVAAIGPPDVDLARLVASIELALRAKGWTARRDSALDMLFRGYRDGLRDPDHPVPEPDFVRRTRARFTSSRSAFLNAVRRMMVDVSPRLDAELRAALDRYGTARTSSEPSLTRDDVVVKKLGAFRAGIGSSTIEKYLVIIEGPSPAPTDDVVLEVKHVPSLTRVSCIHRERGAAHMLEAYAYLGYFRSPYLGRMTLHGDPFWVQQWFSAYEELSIEKSLESPNDLSQILYAIGVQLGRGHPRHSAATNEQQLRRRLLEYVDRYEASIRKLGIALADETTREWRAFVRETDKPPGAVVPDP